MDEFIDCKIKEISTQQLEKAIANAVRDLNGVHYEVRVKSIDYEDSGLDGGNISISIFKSFPEKGSGDIVGNG